MPKITHNDLPAAIEAIMLRIDILHDLVKSTKDAVDKLVKQQGRTSEITDPESAAGDETPVFQGEELMDISKASKFLGIPVTKLYLLVEQRQIAHFSKQNRLFFKKQDLETYQKRIGGKKASRPLKPPHDEPSIVLGDNDSGLLTLDMAAEYTGISKASLYSYAKTKKVPFIKKGGKLYIPIVALNQLMISGIEKPQKSRRKKPGKSQERED